MVRQTLIAPSLVMERTLQTPLFSGKADFNSTIFSGELFFEEIYCIGNAYLQFDNTKFSKVFPTHFKNIRFIATIENEEFKPRESENTPTIAFNRVIFTSQIVFLSCDFNYIQLTDCELTKATIGNCDFPRKQKIFRMPIGSNRILLGNEVFTIQMQKQIEEKNVSERKDKEAAIRKLNENKKEHEPEIKPEPLLKKKKKRRLKYEHYNMMAVTYRQLKTNRADNKDWATAGDAYRSEMVMRRKAIVQEMILYKKPFLVINLLIIWSHDIKAYHAHCCGCLLYGFYLVTGIIYMTAVLNGLL